MSSRCRRRLWQQRLRRDRHRHVARCERRVERSSTRRHRRKRQHDDSGRRQLDDEASQSTRRPFMACEFLSVAALVSTLDRALAFRTRQRWQTKSANARVTLMRASSASMSTTQRVRELPLAETSRLKRVANSATNFFPTFSTSLATFARLSNTRIIFANSAAK